MATNTTTPPKRDLDAILAWLDAGLTLSTYDAQCRERRYRRGEITREKNARGWVRTTHLTSDLCGYVWLTRAGVSALAARVRQQWADMDRLVAAQHARVSAALDIEGR